MAVMDVAAIEDLLAGVAVEPRDYQRRVVGRVIEMFTGPHVVHRHSFQPPAR